jgi:ADP-ribose pyrophosphatase YjhB (NUDIX family)
VRREDGLVLAVRRPDEPGEELPGIWGLPATTLGDGESPEDGLRRLGREKLGVALTPLGTLAEGDQRREGYTLHMTVHEASLEGEPRLPARTPGAHTGDRPGASITLYEALDWLPSSAFREAADLGSLCCRLLLEATPPVAP